MPTFLKGWIFTGCSERGENIWPFPIAIYWLRSLKQWGGGCSTLLSQVYLWGYWCKALGDKPLIVFYC